MLTPQASSGGVRPASPARPLSARESEVLALLAVGMSGAAIAEQLFLSPETVRTHVRNAMEKLGATTRSQAVAIALDRGEIAGDRSGAPVPTEPVKPDEGPEIREATLRAMTAGIAKIPDIDTAVLYLAEEDGMALRLIARAGAKGLERVDATAARVHLGEGKVGRVALEARTELLSESPFSPVIAAAMQRNGRLVGVLCVGARSSRPTSRRELLLVEALGNRIAEVLGSGDGIAPGLRGALERFRVTWSGPGS
jgi:DNA-binding CsgD family transcriptional regulator